MQCEFPKNWIVSPDPFQNAFLKSLDPADFAAIRGHLKAVELREGASLIELGQTVVWAHLPLTAVVSLVVELEAGERIEVALVGSDSILGTFGVLGEPVALVHAVVLVPGAALLVEAARLRALAQQSAAFRDNLMRHSQALFVQAQQSVGCNASHTVEARLARWLLRVRDLSGCDRFKLTQELMAEMIGVRRNSVSFVAHALQQANIIRFSRGHIEIINVDELNRAACECYRAVKLQYKRLRFSTGEEPRA
ncbi:Crp/Fnr family transcriptional regulator [Bradyrhizobium sp. Y36]|uniref:Crp/Fnr family transcriptional regulator n=1 Tax=Bradyrhizobium sp. Y36 TaxID=2035447 RepID=UPI001FE1BD3F|nr:Crp/Fnr family transcriptional regulator [Bradyrhizobium sp. Y36]